MVESLSNEINLNQQHIKRNSVSFNHQQQSNRHINEFDRLTYELTSNNNDVLQDGSLRRIGFYSIGSELGSGNFSKVKLGIHLLTKGK
jgi:serine/threonine-protein kinase NIM1